MPTEIVACQCPHCQQEGDHPDQALHVWMNLLMSRLDEAQRRWYAALEAQRLGHGGDRLVAQITGLGEKTIRRGRAELHASLADCPDERVRRSGAGRTPTEKKRPSDSPGVAGTGDTRNGGRSDERAEVGPQ
ncbi:MAG: hypothetical protein ACR2JC_02165 [Chloroflexota bacterium]